MYAIEKGYKNGRQNHMSNRNTVECFFTMRERSRRARMKHIQRLCKYNNVTQQRKTKSVIISFFFSSLFFCISGQYKRNRKGKTKQGRILHPSSVLLNKIEVTFFFCTNPTSTKRNPICRPIITTI